jgi:hypothetical protein
MPTVAATLLPIVSLPLATTTISPLAQANFINLVTEASGKKMEAVPVDKDAIIKVSPNAV